jgi:hypothetical protein
MYFGVHPQAFFGELAPLGAALIQFGVDEDMPAPPATAPGLILEEFHRGPAVRASYFKNVAGPPKGGVLPRAYSYGHKTPS